MRRKKERNKQGQTNKQGKATQHTQGSEKNCLVRDEKEERKKQARSNKQTTNKAKQHSTPKAHTQGSEKTASGGTSIYMYMFLNER